MSPFLHVGYMAKNKAVGCAIHSLFDSVYTDCVSLTWFQGMVLMVLFWLNTAALSPLYQNGLHS